MKRKKNRINFDRFAKALLFVTKIVVVAVMLVFTFVGASADVQAFGFSLFGYHVSNQGIEKEDDVQQGNVQAQSQSQDQTKQIIQEKEQERVQKLERDRERKDIQVFGRHSEIHPAIEKSSENINNEIKNQSVEVTSEKELVDIEEALRLANNDKYLTANMKSFSGENICIQTDERLAYFTINKEGTIGWLSGEPSKYYTIQTTERYLKQASEKARNGQTVSQKEIENNVDIPFKLKARLMMSKLFG